MKTKLTILTLALSALALHAEDQTSANPGCDCSCIRTHTATMSAPDGRHTTSPIHFWFDYAGTPFPGKRYWTAVGQTWIEQYESGTYSRFKVVKHTNIEGTSGTIAGDPEQSETESDGKFQVFIPDIGSEWMKFRFRHKMEAGVWGPWQSLTAELKGVE